VTEAVTLEPGGKAILAVAYQTRGLDDWNYSFGTESRVQNFTLGMKTDFDEIDFPEGTASPTERTGEAHGWRLLWSYPDEIGARPIGMAMPKVLNPGPTAARITFFAPVSLLFFFDGLTGLTITVGAISTLALLMALTARVNWSEKLRKAPTPPPVPSGATHG